MKCVFACIAMMMMCAASYAQNNTFNEMVEREERVFKGGLVMGMNICQVDGDTYAGYNKVGIHAGATVNIRLGKIFNVSTELLYTQKGTRGAHVYESPYVGTYFDKYYLNLNYIELPVVLQFKRALLWGFEAGISYGRLIGSKEWAYGVTPVYIAPEINYFNNTDLSYLGGGYYFLNKHWVASLRFQYSAIPIRPWNRVPIEYNMFRGQFNNVVTIRMVYML